MSTPASHNTAAQEIRSELELTARGVHEACIQLRDGKIDTQRAFEVLAITECHIRNALSWVNKLGHKTGGGEEGWS